jgi:hypothetical protein
MSSTRLKRLRLLDLVTTLRISMSSSTLVLATSVMKSASDLSQVLEKRSRSYLNSRSCSRINNNSDATMVLSLLEECTLLKVL